MVRAWLMSNALSTYALQKDDDLLRRSECRRTPHQPVSLAFLSREVGLLHYSLPPERDVREATLEQLCSELKCVYRDEVRISGDDAEHVKFFKEHSHADAEIRFIAEGSCYFDVRTSRSDEEWVRVLCEEGDLIIAPPGIRHRFTTTRKVHLHMIRLFTKLPEFITSGGIQPGLVSGSRKFLPATYSN